MDKDAQFIIALVLALGVAIALIGGIATYGNKLSNDALVECVKAGAPVQDCAEGVKK